MLEKFRYDLPKSKNEESGVKNEYVIYILDTKGDTKILSANISPTPDPIDGEVDVNKELGYDLHEKNGLQLLVYRAISLDKGSALSIPEKRKAENIKKMDERIAKIRSYISTHN